MAGLPGPGWPSPPASREIWRLRQWVPRKGLLPQESQPHASWALVCPLSVGVD